MQPISDASAYESNERFVISAATMSTIQCSSSEQQSLQAMIDSGANVNLGPVWIAEALGLQIVPHTDTRQIGTANSAATLVIKGWIFPCGYTGPIAIVDNAAFILLSTSQLQQHGMGIHLHHNTTVCTLVTAEGDFAEIAQCPSTHLYFIDLRTLIGSDRPLDVAQREDVHSGVVQRGGCCGYIPYEDLECHAMVPSDPTDEAGASQSLQPAQRLRGPTLDVTSGVWRLHACFGYRT